MMTMNTRMKTSETRWEGKDRRKTEKKRLTAERRLIALLCAFRPEQWCRTNAVPFLSRELNAMDVKKAKSLLERRGSILSA